VRSQRAEVGRLPCASRRLHDPHADTLTHPSRPPAPSHDGWSPQPSPLWSSHTLRSLRFFTLQPPAPVPREPLHATTAQAHLASVLSEEVQALVAAAVRVRPALDAAVPVHRPTLDGQLQPYLLGEFAEEVQLM